MHRARTNTAAARSTLRPRGLVVAKLLLFIGCLLPLGWTSARVLTGEIGPNPVEEITHATGDWALRLLLVTLAVTPLRRLTGRVWLVRLRRMLGLFAFFYAVLHFTTYLWLDQFFDWQAIMTDITKRPYITVGFAALVLMAPLAVTSTKGWMRRLGPRWKRLHRLVYGIAVLGVLHYLWLVKADLLEPLVYAGILGLLLAARLPITDWLGWARQGISKRPESGRAKPAGERGASNARA